MIELNNSNIKLINNKPKSGSKDSLVVFLHPKDFNGVLVELCQKKLIVTNPEFINTQTPYTPKVEKINKKGEKT